MSRRAYPYLSIKGCGTNYTNYPTQVSIKSRSHKPPQIPGHLESFTNYTTQIPGHLEFPAWLAGHRQPGVEVTVGGVTCLKKSVYMSGLLVIGTSTICGGATTHNNRDGFAGKPRMMDPFSNSTFCTSLSYKHNAKSGVARDGGKSSIFAYFLEKTLGLCCLRCRRNSFSRESTCLDLNT